MCSLIPVTRIPEIVNALTMFQCHYDQPGTEHTSYGVINTVIHYIFAPATYGQLLQGTVRL